MDTPLSEVLAIERREYASKLGELTKERETAIERIRRGTPSGARQFQETQERLKFLQKIVEVRVELRGEYGQNDPRLLAADQIEALFSEIERTVDGFTKLRGPGEPSVLRPRTLGELGDIKARARTALDKLVLKTRWDEMKKDAVSVSVNVQNSSGTIVNVNSLVGDIHSHLRVLRESGQDGVAVAIAKLTDAVKESSDLLAERQSDTLQSLAFLAQSASLPPPQRQLGVVKTMYSGLALALAHAADVAQIWAVCGPQIASFFGFAA